ncbi:glycine betaine ABC transporter substrate-binding protein [Geobacter sp.]|uniref:glycine betaine ABC transporter substrate-binding protein n=1 Tax=Geobacter sp. TaxID=46610 RepID=UPI0026266087|nr:glycine betaine ABC transporter substrate-binding protein [Geobacter sp.]
MKRIGLTVVVAMVLVWAQLGVACVGKTLFIGIPGTAGDRMLAEMVSTLINERTGTAVKIQTYRDSREVYEAVRQGKVNIIIENPEHALALLGRPAGPSGKKAYEIVKGEYRRKLNLTWLEPFGMPQGYAPVLTVETLENYPALPKLLTKLAGALNGDAYARLLKASDGGERSKKAVKDFLKAKKLI